jgi:tetratricopeptide (TPR) repeat protein
MVSSADQAYDDAMQETQNAKAPRKTASSLRPKASSNPRAARVSFSESPAEEKKVDDETPSPSPSAGRRVSRRSSDEGKRPSAKTGNESAGSVRRVKGKEIKKEDEPPSPPNKGFMAGIGKRLSKRFSDNRKGFVKFSENTDDEDEEEVEDDPVMTIFESRNTQRVRFSLEGVGDDPHEPREDATLEKQSGASIKTFMSRALFSSGKPSKKLDEEMEREVASLAGSLVWESAATPTGPEVIHTKSDKQKTGAALMLSFTEDPKARATVVKLLNKARRAEHFHFRYEYAVKCYLKALSILKTSKYPDDHPTVVKAVKFLNSSHHVLSSYNNSANIVKIGMKYEDSGELVRALKMYTIAYRIRRDNLSRNHPSLVVLLNMLGSIQIKRGELKEAMQIYELALKDSPVIFNANEEDDEVQPPTGNLLAKSVTYREMGTIYERWGNVNEALNIYHKSLQCVAEWKEAVRGDDHSASQGHGASKNPTLDYSISNVQLTRSAPGNSERGESEKGEMELFLAPERQTAVGVSNSGNMYESFFPSHLDEQLDRSGSISKSSSSKTSRDSYADMDLALTLHQIAQLHRCQGEFARALDAYEVALRGMKYALGKHHPNVAAVLGNIGNLQKEMGDLDAAHNTYQEVLGIESYRLGLSHPDVAITIHNIATIDAARGNYEHALQLYRKVLGLQKKLFGDDHLSVAVTAACMGDVYERLGEYSNALESFEDACRIKSAALGRHSLDVARLLHKLGKLAFLRSDFHMADSFLSRAVLIYRLNKIADDHEWLVDANRDTADIDGAIVMGRGRQFEC